MSATAHASAAPTRTGPPTLTPADIRFPRRSRPLRPGSPADAGLVPEHVARVADEAARHLHPVPHGQPASHPGFVLLAAHDAVVVAHEARGHAVRYASWDDDTDTAVELPADEQVPMAKDTIFDMASITKLFTSTVAMQLVEEGAIDLDEPVAAYLPEFAATDSAKAAITVRHFLTHRSGLIAWLNLYALPDDETRMQTIYGSELQREPGSGYEYSDLNMITLAHLMHRVTGAPLDELVAERVARPLGLRDTMFNPPEKLWPRVAATEYQPWTDRGMIVGTVHDENAYSFGGVAGHAGIFSTARDIAVFGQMLCDGGAYGSRRILKESSVRAAITDYSEGESPRGLGWQVDQRWFMDALNSRVTAGHTGYTGTSLVVDPVTRMVFALLTNRVHPTRNYGGNSIYRRDPARAFARSLPVKPATGRTSWFGGMADATTATLTAPLRGTGDRAKFRLWYDTEEVYDPGSFEASGDGQTWSAVPFTLRTKHRRWTNDGTFDGYAGRTWLDASAQLPAGTTQVRWTYARDAGYQGRGVYVDGIRVFDGEEVVFHSDRPADAARLQADGWTESRD